MSKLKLSSKNQVVVPREIREGLGLKAGDEITMVLQGDHALLMAKPQDIVEQLYGSCKGMYLPDPDTYLKRERASWERKKLRKS